MNAQTLGEYSFSTGVDANKWITISDSTNLLVTGTNDSRYSAVENIGFTFPFAEDVYTQFSVNSDGNLRLGPTVTGTGSYSNPFNSSNSNTNSPKINFFGCDGYYLDTIHYVYAENTVDANNNSFLCVEFCLGTYTSATRTQKYKWQVHLYPNGNIQVVMAPTAPTTAPATSNQKGLCVNSSDGWTIDSDNIATHFTAGSTTTWASGTWPAPNTYYIFTRPVITCPRPASINVSNIGTTTATVSFTPSGNETSWVGTITPGIMGMTTITLTDTIVNLYMLNPNTEYTVSVRALCGEGDTSSERTTTFRTLCTALTAADLPYTDDFESYGTGSSNPIDPCWTKGTNSSTAYPYPYSTNAINGSRSLYFYSTKSSSATGTSYYSYAVLPELDATLNTSGLTLRFFSKRYTSTSATYRSLIQVGVMTDPTDPTTFEMVEMVNMTPLPALTVQYNEIDFSSYTGTGKYIAFYAPVIDTEGGSATNYIYIDDVELVTTPTCYRPTDVVISNISAYSATVSWTPADITTNNFVVAYGTGTDPSIMSTVSVSGTSTSITGLTPASIYNVYVKAVCGTNDESEWSRVSSFSTSMVPFIINAHSSYTENFEGTPQLMLLNAPTNKWTVGQAVNNGGEKSMYISNDNGVSNAYTVTSTQWSYAVKTFNFAAGDVHISFDWKANGESNYDYLRAFLVPLTVSFTGGIAPGEYTPSSFRSVVPEGWIALDGGSKLNLSTSWQTILDSVTFDSPASYNLVFIWANDNSSGSQPPAAIDNINVFIPTFNPCTTPSNVVVSNITESSATVTWSGDSVHNGYMVRYFFGDDSATATTPDTILILAGLSPNTPYSVTVQAICDTDAASDWSTPVTFNTLCAAVLVDMSNPFYETFESTSPTVNCWSTESRDGGPSWFIDHFSHTSTYYAYNGVSYFFDGGSGGGYGTLFTPVLNLGNADSAQLSFMYINPKWISIPKSSDAKPIDQNELAVLYRNNDTAAWDTLGFYNTNVTIWTPVTLTIPNLSSTLQIAFDAYNNGGYCIGIDSVVVEAFQDYCHPAPSSCDGQGITNVTFGNGNEVVNNSLRPTSSPYYGDYSDQIGAVPAGDEAIIDITYATGYSYGTIIWVDWNNNHVFDGNEVVFVGEAPSTNPTLFNASFEIPTTMDTGLYRMRIAGADSYYNSYISSIAAAANANPCPNSTYTIVHDYTLHVTAPASCPKPLAVSLNNITVTSASISITPAGEETEWVATINPAIMGTSQFPVNNTTFNLLNLTPNTDYTIAIRAICGVGDTSNARTLSFHTPCADLNLPYSENFDELSNSLPDCWLKVGSGTVARYMSYTDAHSGIYSLRFSGSTSNLVVLPPFDTTSNVLQMTLWMRPESFTSFSCGTFSVGYITDINDANSFVAVETYSYNDFSSIEQRTINFAEAPANARLALRHNASSTSWFWFVDDIDVHLQPSCLVPSGLTASMLSNTSAYVSWNANLDVNNYTVAYGTGTDPDSMPTLLVNTYNATITGLTPETLYNIYVKANCSATDISDWSIPTTVYTGYCLPNPTSCDGQGITNVTFGTGDETVNNSTRPTEAPFYGNYYNMVGAAHVGSMVNLNITYSTGYTYGTIVWVDWNNNFTFDSNEVVFAGTSLSDNPTVFNAGFVIPATQDTGVYRMRIVGADSYFDSYTGSIADAANANPCFSSAWSVAHDYSLHVLPQAACADPYNVTFSNITSNSANVSWTTSDSLQNNFMVRYTSDNITFDSFFVSGTSTILTGLLANTSYYVTVKTICGTTDHSNWSAPASFTTLCGVITVTETNPFYESFDLTSSTINCWGTTGNNWQLASSSNSGGFQAFSGTSAFANGSSLSDDDLLASPVFNLSGYNSASLNFVYINPVWSSDQNELTVLYRNADDTAWNTLATYNTSVTSWTPVSLIIPTVSSATQIGFYFTDNWGYCAAVDSLTLIPASTYNVTLATNNSILGTTNPAPGTYAYLPGDTLTISAIPATNCHFVQWNDGDTNASRLITVTGDVTYTAFFDYNPITVTLVNANASLGTITPAPGIYTFNVGDTIATLATANSGCHFVKWLISSAIFSDSTTINPISMIIPAIMAGANITMTAQFAADQYTITAVANDNALGTVTGSGVYGYNTYATLTATPAASCHFVQWNDGDTNTTRSVLVTGNATYTAYFEYDSVTFILTNADTAMGSVTPAPGIYVYHVGDTVTATATANFGYHFNNWLISIGILVDSNNSNPVTLVVPSYLAGLTVNVAPQFAPNQYTIAALSNNDSLGTVSGTGMYDYNTYATITATPAAHCAFVEWNDGDTNAVRNILVTGNATYTATFRAIPQHTVTLTVVPDNAGTVSGEGTYYEGDNVTIIAIPNEGYEFNGWAIEADGDPFDYAIFSHDAILTFPMGENDINYFAVFNELPVSVELSILTNDETMGYVLVNGEQTTTYTGHVGDTITLQAVANEGFHFSLWTITGLEDSIMVDPVISYVITENSHYVIAVFQPNVGIDDNNSDNTLIYSVNNNIVVRGAEQQTIRVFDVVGRLVAQRNDAAAEETIAMPNTGIYLVKIGNAPAKRVVVRR